MPPLVRVESVPGGASAPSRPGPLEPQRLLMLLAAEAMEGALLPLEQRRRLHTVGAALGLAPFEVHLAIAVAQDRARLREGRRRPRAGRPWLATAAWCMGLLGAELVAALAWWWG